MNHVTSWTKVGVLSIIALAVNFLLLDSMPGNWYSSLSYVSYFALYQIILIPGVLLLSLNRLQTFAISGILLLTLNLFVPAGLSADFKTLPPNYYERIEVVGSVMPNFSGINTISTDEKGFRSNGAVDYDTASTFRIFAIGASTTEEIYVDDNETWTSLLEANLNDTSDQTFEVINTGVSGLRAEHNLATMMETEKYHPDAYIFLMGVNDWNKQIRDNFSPHQPIINKGSETLIFSAISLIRAAIVEALEPQGKEAKIGVRQEFGSMYVSQNDSLSRQDLRSYYPDEVIPDYSRVLERITDRCSIHEYFCVFLSQPSAYSASLSNDLKTRLWMTPPNENYTLDLASLIAISTLYNNETERIAKESGVMFCDLASQIPPTTAYLYDDVHFNESGSVLVSEIIHECVGKALAR